MQRRGISFTLVPTVSQVFASLSVGKCYCPLAPLPLSQPLFISTGWLHILSSFSLQLCYFCSNFTVRVTPKMLQPLPVDLTMHVQRHAHIQPATHTHTHTSICTLTLTHTHTDLIAIQILCLLCLHSSAVPPKQKFSLWRNEVVWAWISVLVSVLSQYTRPICRHARSENVGA